MAVAATVMLATTQWYNSKGCFLVVHAKREDLFDSVQKHI
jgi:hypothetical protein